MTAGKTARKGGTFFFFSWTMGRLHDGAVRIAYRPSLGIYTIGRE